MDDKEDSILSGNNAFVNKLLSKKSFSDHSSRNSYYYSNKECVVPFTWEEEPGTPKESPKLEDNVETINSPPPSTLSPLNQPLDSSLVQPQSCFLKMKPRRTTKPNKKAQIVLKENIHDDYALEESSEFGHYESYISDYGDIFSSSCNSNWTPSSEGSNSTGSSSKGLALALLSSKFRNRAKGILRRFF